MDFFRKKRHITEDPNSQTVAFKLGKRCKALFDEKYGMRQWSRLEKVLSFQSHEMVFLRIGVDNRGNTRFRALLPLPSTDKWLRITFRQDDKGPGFFVLFLDIDTHGPNPAAATLSTNREPLFLEVWDPVDDPNAHWAFYDQLMALKPSKIHNRREVKKEIALWKMYLEALEKVMKEKTVLLQVKSGNQFTQKSRRTKGKDTYIEYELDTNSHYEKAAEIFADFEGGIVAMKKTGGHLDLPGDAFPTPLLLKQWEKQLKNHHFQLAPKNQRWERFLTYHLTFSLRTSAAQHQWLTEMESGLLSESDSRKQGEYRCHSWDTLTQLQQKIEEFPEVLKTKGHPTAHFTCSHWLVDTDTRKAILNETRKIIQKEDRVNSIKKSGTESFELAATLNISDWLAKEFPDFELEQVESQLTFLPAEDQKLPKIQGTTLRNSTYHFSAVNWKSLVSHRSKLTTQVDGTPSESTEIIKWQIRLKDPSKDRTWQDTLSKEIKSISGASLAYPNLTSIVPTEAQSQAFLKSLRKNHPDLVFEPAYVSQQVTFFNENSTHRKNISDQLRGKLMAHLGKAVKELVPTDKGWSYTGLLRPKDEAQLHLAQQLLQQYASELPGIEIRTPEAAGTLRLHFQFSKKLYQEFLDELWKNLKYRKMKLLSAQQHAEYLAEVEGQGGNYRGGEEIGSLNSLRGGKLKIKVDDPNDLPDNFRRGTLLPVFVGDLATLGRLKWAIRTIQRPEKHFPKNQNLAHFLFDPSVARKIEVQEDIRSDRFWQLKHELNEKNLNEKQKEAVWKALHAEDMVLIQGPPGTGKTTVIAEIIWQMLQEDPDCKILISSQAHLAVDNALERLYKKNLIRPLRIASSSYAKKAIEPEGQKYVEEVIEKWAKASPASKEETENNKNAVSAWIDRIGKNTQPNPTFSLVQTIWKKRLTEAPPGVKKFFANLYLDNVNIVAATCLECGRKDFREKFIRGFDCVIVDEASKATPPELLLPMISGRKVVIIGDHKQLPPMIDEREISEVLKAQGADELAQKLEEIKTAQFEKLFHEAPESVKITLNTQYRMHAQIMEVINAFYEEEGGLTCGISTTMDLPDLTNKGSRWHGFSNLPILDQDQHVLWIDVTSPETFHNPSYSNSGEVEAIRIILNTLLQADGFAEYMDHWEKPEDKEIGLVSFYGKQVEKLEELRLEFTEKLPIRLRTVDKFQGMERNIMIISTVRSDTQVQEGKEELEPKANAKIGFAKDYRRINVAFSRARRLLIIVGNENHFAKNGKAYKYIQSVIGKQGGRLDITQLSQDHAI